MPTANFNLPIYTAADTAALDTLLNGQSNAIDAALLTTEGRAIGTNAARLALTGSRRKAGLVWYATDTNIEWRWDGSAWKLWNAPKTTFTPTWVNFTPGTSAIIASYGVASGRLFGDVSVTLASGWSIGGNVAMNAPYAATAPSGLRSLGTGVILDNGSGYFRIRTLQSATGVIELWRESADFMGQMTATSPITFVTGDQFHFGFEYFV